MTVLLDQKAVDQAFRLQQGSCGCAVQETWLISEFCDKGNLDRAVSGGRFHDRSTGAPEMVRDTSKPSHNPKKTLLNKLSLRTDASCEL